ncbi:hypothetical protein GPALN_014699 [Globodera pallida]|nr:hypothetical protein GPALN_014699 [Globodera pallida]
MHPNQQRSKLNLLSASTSSTDGRADNAPKFHLFSSPAAPIPPPTPPINPFFGSINPKFFRSSQFEQKNFSVPPPPPSARDGLQRAEGAINRAHLLPLKNE